MNDWIPIEEFKKEAIEKNWFGWCWIYLGNNDRGMAYYLVDFYFFEYSDCGEIWDINKITHVIPLDNPKDPD